MGPNSFSDIVTWYDQLWQNDKNSDFTEKIREILARETDNARVNDLKHILRFELIRHERFSEAMEVLEKQIQEDPKDIQLRVRAAEDLLYYFQDPRKALAKIDLVLPLAKTSHEFHRHALHVKARILRALRDYLSLADCLREIMAVSHAKGRIDVGRESDFLDNLPENAIPKELLEDFDKYLSVISPEG